MQINGDDVLVSESWWEAVATLEWNRVITATSLSRSVQAETLDRGTHAMISMSLLSLGKGPSLPRHQNPTPRREQLSSPIFFLPSQGKDQTAVEWMRK